MQGNWHVCSEQLRSIQGAMSKRELFELHALNLGKLVGNLQSLVHPAIEASMRRLGALAKDAL